MSLIRPVLILQFGWLVFAAAACGKGSEGSGAAGTSRPEQAAAQAEPTLYGRWSIIAINGAAPLRFDQTERSRPHLVFSPSNYGGSTGCNSFSGTGLLVGKRWFGELPIATQQGCAHLTAQEQAIMSIAASGPAVTFQGQAEAALTSTAGSLRLRREGDSGPETSEPAPMLLAGTSWEVGRIDGFPVGELSRRERARLIFEADRWTLDAGCSLLSGQWRQAGSAVTINIASPQPRGCSPTLKAEDEAVRAMIAASPQYVVGPNREFVMGGGDHWLTGEFDRSPKREWNDILRGEWRVDAVDGAAPKDMQRPPSLIFGNHSYAVWGGCNHTEGVMLVFERQLFPRGSGMSTLANCMPDPLRAHIRGIVGSNPRVAKTDGGGIALVAPSGTLRLTRLSGRGFGTGEQLGLRAPRAITLLKPDARLTLLTGNKFAVQLPCGRIEGDWRGGQPARFSPDPLERTAPNCDRDPASDAFRLSQFFTGNVLAVTGPNRDIVLLVNEDESLAGQVAN